MSYQRPQRLRFLQRLFLAISAISLLIPGIHILRSLLLGIDLKWSGEHILLHNILFTFTVSSAIFAANISTGRSLDKYLPWTGNVRRRIIVEFLITSFNAAIIMLLWTYMYFKLIDVQTEAFKIYLFENILIALIVNIIATTVMESNDIFQQWKASLVEAERMQKESLRTQYEALKAQVNPHFLFNSLNTLSSLVHADPYLAEEFIDEFARFYRYILEIRDKNLVSLKEEMEMMDTYVYLQKIRFGQALKLENHIGPAYAGHLIPPLTLQILAENAIKHNALSEEAPLRIELRVENGFLVIRNSLRQRQEAVRSTGMGLYNLKEKYRILSEAQPHFGLQDQQYVASVPLIIQQN
jgi:sensor histidine kinase YesM